MPFALHSPIVQPDRSEGAYAVEDRFRRSHLNIRGRQSVDFLGCFTGTLGDVAGSSTVGSEIL
jgi:hypothetical protein